MHPRHAAARAAELALLGSETRHDPAAVAALLHDGFVEIGRSGRRWTRDDIIASLADESERTTPDTAEWAFADLPGDLVLVTYRLTGATGSSRHSSMWDLSAGPDAPRLRLHPGTPVAAA